MLERAYVKWYKFAPGANQKAKHKDAMLELYRYMGLNFNHDEIMKRWDKPN